MFRSERAGTRCDVLRFWTCEVQNGGVQPTRKTRHLDAPHRDMPSAERNGLLMRSVKSAFALLLTKVTKRIPTLNASGCIGQADILLRSTLLLNDGLRPY